VVPIQASSILVVYPKPTKFSRVNIYGRDGYSCQYCGVKKKMISELTYDHVVPRAQGGKTTWTNIVTCCSDCNREKANLKEPVWPTSAPVLVVTVSSESVPDAWRDYLYWTGELEQD
jgi:hypothetical protein